MPPAYKLFDLFQLPDLTGILRFLMSRKLTFSQTPISFPLFASTIYTQFPGKTSILLYVHVEKKNLEILDIQYFTK